MRGSAACGHRGFGWPPFVLATGFVIASLLVAETGLACSPRIFIAHHIDEAERAVDHTPPARPRLRLESVTRGHGAVVENGSIIVDTCGGIGTAHLVWERPPKDDRAVPADIGITWKRVRGRLPRHLREPDAIEVLPNPALGYRLDWDDSVSDGKDRIDFEIVIVLVDRAGNQSVASPRIRIVHSGKRLNSPS
jgi:hypothetical protein